MKYNSTAIAIFIGFILVAGAIYFSEIPFMAANGGNNATSATRIDHRYVYGDARAPITIVEFSDFECPYCAQLHPTLKRLVDESDGGIAWEYRHLPLPMHANADNAAYAAECVGLHAGDEAFWQYGLTLFENYRNINQTFLKNEALALGLSEKTYDACIVDPVITARVEADMQAAAALGGSGTPFSVVVFPDGTLKPVSGALPYDSWRTVLES